MIQDIIDTIAAALADTPGIKGEPAQYVGNLGELVKQPKRLPALWLIYDGADFVGREVVDGVYAGHTMQFTVVLLAKNHRSRVDGAEACHTIIEAVRARLIGLLLSDYDAELWPVSERLIDASGPLLVYALSYQIKTSYSSS